MAKMSVLASIFVASVFATNATAQPAVSSTGNSIPGIETAGSGSIPSNIAVELGSSSASALLPYAMVVHNTGSLSVTGLVIRYEISVNGQSAVWIFKYLHGPDLASSNTIPVIAPGASTVIVPNPNLTQQLAKTGTVSPTAQDIVRIEPDADALSRAATVAISVDSVIRSDGTMFGPDRSLQFDAFERQIAEYTEFRSTLLGLFAKGAAVADINAWLQQTADQMVVRRPNESEQGIALVKSTAQKYLFLIQNHGLQYAWDQLKASPPEKVCSQYYKVHRPTPDVTGATASN